MSVLRKYSDFIKLEHTLFSLPIIFAGVCLAETHWPPLRTIVLIILAATGGRVAAMTLNRIVDRKIDALNPRTSRRALASGAMKLWEAAIVLFLALGLYFVSAAALNPLCVKLAPIPLVGWILYPFFQRITHWTHLGLGVVWSCAPVAGFLAVKPAVQGLESAVVLAVFALFWLAGFDIIYALQDEDFDRANNIRSLPAAVGGTKALVYSAVFHGLAFAALIVLYSIWFSGTFTVMLLMLIGLLLYFEQKASANTPLAFFRINAAIGFVVFFFVLFGLLGF